ncbi:MAG: hypothetical protein IPM80_16715 [Proteobacteria bacterium]|nr:hypothetical protein [Pseudomonadota bacterium]
MAAGTISSSAIRILVCGARNCSRGLNFSGMGRSAITGDAA